MSQPEPSRKDRWKMFDRISPSYDKINRIISFGMDQSWRRQVVKHLPDKTRFKLLDIATGTGDQLLSIFDHCKRVDKAVGIDLSSDMMKLAQNKINLKSYSQKISLQRADAQNLPFTEDAFDAVTFTFGIRNVPSPKIALREIHRVLKSKGRCIILEFSLPPQPIRPFYLFYIRTILPWVGKALSKDKDAYSYLNQTIETFPYGKAFALLMKEEGFHQIEIHPMALGAVSLYLGVKR